MLRTDPYQVVKSGARSSGRVGRRITFRDVLLGVQIAICAVLVFGAVYTDTAPSAPGPVFTDMQPTPPAHDAVFALNHNQGEPRAVPVAFTNTNPVIRLGGGSLFDQIPLPPTTLISQPLGNN